MVLLGTQSLLVAFSIASVMLEQPALSIMAGTASISFAGEIIRRFLFPPGGPSTVPAEPPTEPPLTTESGA